MSRVCDGGKPLGFGFGVGDDPDAPVGLDNEGYDVACGQLGAICAFWGAGIPLTLVSPVKGRKDFGG